MKEERSGKEGGMYREEYPRMAVHPCGWPYEVIDLRGRGSAARQKALLQQEGSSVVGETVECGPQVVVGGADGLRLQALADDEFSELRIPLDGMRHLSGSKSLLLRGEKEDGQLIIARLFVFLRELEVQLCNLCMKPFVTKDELSLLADEACELKCMAREALVGPEEVASSVDTPFQPAGDDFSAPADEGNAAGDTEASDDFFRDGEGV
ncbi:hypothetical protein [Akkermansia glycaniphila]|uniref:hypothetical protein n=1 Tax=Akkermansia glycaniphila TaxID=1679444 RepID=UPI0012EB93F7|nr:hypothetical protein [Akkermansia glycaniphila]